MQDLQQVKQRIDSLDLFDVIERLVKVDKWKRKHAMEACEQYRKFLFLKRKYGDQYVLPPSYDIDEAWHAHILHTKDYIKFCEEVFGEYLHHHPATKNSHFTDQEISKLFEKTQFFYNKEFGNYIYAVKLTFIERLKGIIARIREYRDYKLVE